MKTLDERLRKIEDKLAIYDLIASHPPSADTAARDFVRTVWVEDGVFDREGEISCPGAASSANPPPR